MNLHDQLISELKKLYPNVPRLELEKIVDSEFRLIERVISNKECKVIGCVGLGKFYPSGYRRRLEEQNKLKEDETNRQVKGN